MINIDNNLILIKGIDKTTHIDRWDYQAGYISVTFLPGGKTYRYNSSNVEFYKEPEELSPQKFRILKSGQSLSNVIRIQKFDRHIRVFYKSGYHETFGRNSVAIMPSSLNNSTANDLFSYFKELAHVDTLLGTDGMPILGKHFDKIDFVREDSVLSDYLKGSLFDNQHGNAKTLIYPFGFNASQKQAVDNALNHKISIIEGPPGTGKTQTILNIIANAVMRGESVAVVSSNNSATENVEEKLRKYDVDFISAFLGSASNKEAFILKQKKIPQFDTWRLTAEEKSDITLKLSKLHGTLENMLLKKNNLSKLRLELEQTKLEEQHFTTYYIETNDANTLPKSLRKLNSTSLLMLMAQAEIGQETGTSLSFFSKLLNFLHYGIYNSSFYHNSLEKIVAVCQKQYYKAKIEELVSQIGIIEKELIHFDFDVKMKEYSDFSMRLFRQKLSEKYENKVRQIYTEEDLWKHSESFIYDYPIILSTTHSLRSSLNSQFVYDYIIVDEASQVSVTTGTLAFSCAKKAVVVGDLMQLPNVVDNEMKKRTDAIWSSYDISEAYRYSSHSLLLSITELFKEVPKVMLQEHYRCNPKIINFCNQKFYNNQLIILTEDNAEISPLVVYQTVPGNHAREHMNQRQIDVIKNEVIPQQHLCVKNPSIGIVTPYRNQANTLQKEFSETAVKADTVDKFQGQERDVIILSTVDNDISDFADDDHRLNVAISRAIKQLIVVISGNQPTRETGIGDLVKYIRYNNMEVINSEVYSVFDLLYKQYADIRRRELSKKKHVSEFDSENIMLDLICQVLREPSFQQYDVLLHVPLRMILRDLSKLSNDRAIGFVMNENTHVDFLVFDKLSHQPILVVEVDGVSYHKKGSVQAERDKLKDAILAQYSIPVVRFRTNESNEKIKLITELKKIVQ
ncbi:AAA domain-containing protein [Hydrogenoanaerobacterium sp.]|uniref:AAA domain-containing protein n=1 Tax=Hydrogenoanaerobacterium sp. TaxID=2953763 RepID=UPI00289B4D82|nr:AAA domain-containing protein [Hydrogenoanaerobacterium sp.]